MEDTPRSKIQTFYYYGDDKIITEEVTTPAYTERRRKKKEEREKTKILREYDKKRITMEFSGDVFDFLLDVAIQKKLPENTIVEKINVYPRIDDLNSSLQPFTGI